MSVFFWHGTTTYTATQTEPVESLLRSLLLVFMDNASAEYTFLKTFFAPEASLPPAEVENSLLSPTSIMSPTDRTSVGGSDFGGTRSSFPTSISAALAVAKEEQQATDVLWKQIWDPVLQYVQVYNSLRSGFSFSDDIFRPL